MEYRSVFGYFDGTLNQFILTFPPTDSLLFLPFSLTCNIQILNTLVTKILGGHHHHDHDHDHDNRATRSSGSVVEDEDETSEHIACPCHDENPVETLEKVQFMAREIEEQHHKQHQHPKTTTTTSTNEQPQQQENDIDNDDQSTGFGKGHVDPEVAHRHNHTNQQQPVHDVDAAADTNDDENVAEDEAMIAEQQDTKKNDKHLMRMSLNTALAIGLHNFPEGLATFVATLDDPKVGGVLAVAIAIHNIPEGLCVAMPIYYATGNRWQAFGWAVLSGIAEPLAGFLAWLILANSFSDTLYAVLFGMVSGMMVIIAIRELMPTAHRYDPEDSVVTVSFIVGMGIMALSLVLFLL